MASLLMLEIITGYTRPVISLEINKTNFCNNAATGMTDGIDNVTCLIDTGADTPVWTQGEERLQLAYKAEKIKDKKFILSGFGLGYEIVDVYEVHDLELKGQNEKGEDDKIIFKNIAVACTSRPAMIADIILPATAFSHMDLSIRTLDVISPVVEIAHKKEDYFVNALYRTDDDRFVDKVYSFANQ